MGKGSLNLIDHTGSLVASNKTVDNVVEISGIGKDELVEATTTEKGTQETPGRQIPVYWGCTLMVLCRELM